MDPTTEAVRAMYEQFPYPAVANPELRLGSDVRLLLSYGRLPHPPHRPLQLLDAGCGRGNGALGSAASQPDVQVTAIDINRVALGAGTAKARELGLKNIRFQEVDSMTLDGLDVPPGGFDLIVSSGVRCRPPAQVTGLCASLLLSLKDQTTPFKGLLLIERLRNAGIDRSRALDAIAELLDREILYAPHFLDA